MSVQEEQQVSELAEKDKLAVDRLTALFDDGAFTEIDGYAKSASGDVEAAAGFGTVNGCPVYCRQLFGCQCLDGQYGRCGDRRKGRRFLCNHPQ